MLFVILFNVFGWVSGFMAGFFLCWWIGIQLDKWFEVTIFSSTFKVIVTIWFVGMCWDGAKGVWSRKS